MCVGWLHSGGGHGADPGERLLQHHGHLLHPGQGGVPREQLQPAAGQPLLLQPPLRRPHQVHLRRPHWLRGGCCSHGVTHRFLSYLHI